MGAGAIGIVAVAIMFIAPIQVVTALVCHDLCSAAFVSRLDPEQDYAERTATRPGMRWIDWALRYHVDRTKHEVTASLAGYDSQTLAVEALRARVGDDGPREPRRLWPAVG